MNLGLLVIAAFILLQFYIGYRVSKKIESGDDYFLAGRSNGMLLISFSAFATWFGSESCISSSSLFYMNGFAGGRAEPFGFTLALLIFGFLLAPKIWKANITTLGDLFANKYGRNVELITAFILMILSLFWSAGQLRAFGQVMVIHTDLSLNTAIVVATVIAVLYTTMGGLLADAYTDFLQGLVLIVSLFTLLVMVFTDSPLALETLMNTPTQRWYPFSKTESHLTQIDNWLIPIFGSLVSQELIAKAAASRSAGVARKSHYVAALMYLLVGAVPALLGMVGPALMPGMESTEQYLMSLANNYLPPFMFVVFSGALICIILSTVDSTMLSVGAILSQNVFPKNKGSQLVVARISVVLAGITACILACTAESIFDLVMTASSFGTSGILVTALFALYTKIGTRASALCAIVSGLATTIAGTYILDWPAPYLSSLAVAFVAFLIPPLLERRSASFLNGRSL